MHHSGPRRLLLVGLLLLFSVLASAQGFHIDRWDETITIQADAKIHVEERITVTFTEPRHGLFRTIPVRYDTGRGTRRAIYIPEFKVLDPNGKRYTVVDTSEGDSRKLRIGDANITLAAGTQKTYIIRYLASNAVNWFEDPKWTPSAELYWNVTGNEWPVNIRNVHVTINYPASAASKGVRVKVFTGPLGSRTSRLVDKATAKSWSDSTDTTVSLSESKITVERVQPLPTGHGLTVVVNVPTKLVPKRAIVEENQGNSTDYSGGETYGGSYYPDFPASGGWPLSSSTRSDPAALFWVAGIPLAVLALMGIAWLLAGRDPESGPIVVQFDPPNDLTGPECGVMVDETVDPRDVTAGIISLAVRGYIRIHPKEEGLIFKSRTAMIEVIKSGPGPELTSFEMRLFNRIAASGNWVSDMDLRQNVAPYLSSIKDTLYEMVVQKGYYRANPAGVRANWALFGGVLSILLAFLGFFQLQGGLLWVFAGAIGGIIVSYVASGWMPIRTPEGSAVHNKIIGFREFMARARSSEMQWMAEKHPDQAMFEKYLPHAVAFDLVKEWADAFKGIAEAMPTWYVGDYDGSFDLVWFASDLNNISDSVGSYITNPPRQASYSDGGFWSGGGFAGGSSGFSSGFGGGFSSGSSSSGGGGYSGGGGGGGGGGSW